MNPNYLHKIKSSYYETNKEEFTLLSHQRVEIEQYLYQFFLQKGLLLQKILYQKSGKYLNIFLYYYRAYFDSTQKKKRTLNLNYDIIQKSPRRINRQKLIDVQYKKKKKRLKRKNKLKRLAEKLLKKQKKSKNKKQDILNKYYKMRYKPGGRKFQRKLLKKKIKIKIRNKRKKKKKNNFDKLKYKQIQKKKLQLKKEKLKNLYNMLLYNLKNHKVDEKVYNEKTIKEFKRIRSLLRYRNTTNRKKYKTYTLLKKNFFQERMLETLSSFTNNKYHISLIFKTINRGITLQLNKGEKSIVKRQALLEKRYSKDNYFRDSINLLIIGSKTNNSSNIFSSLLTEHLKYLRFHKRFLYFIANVLKVIIFSNRFMLKGIKITINGRLNNKSRAKGFNIKLGSVSTVTKRPETVDYSEKTCYTKNGTLGIKVWCEHFKK